jgi:hypothetical protein
MSMKDIKMFDSKAFQNVPKLGIWFENKPSGNPDANFFLIFITDGSLPMYVCMYVCGCHKSETEASI